MLQHLFNLISFDGALGITTGIQRKDIEKAIALIHEQVEKIKSGAFSEELFATSKDLLYASIKGTKDEMASFMAYAYQCIVERTFDLKATLQEIKAVTRGCHSGDEPAGRKTDLCVIRRGGSRCVK